MIKTICTTDPCALSILVLLICNNKYTVFCFSIK
jgi:hypothetical protein